MAQETKARPGLEAETAVIGAMVAAPEIVKDVLFAVREQDFRIEINQQIFRAARDLYLRAKPVTPVTIRDKVGKESSEYLAQLLEITTTSANWREYAAIMAEQASMRRMQELAMQVATAGTAQECRELAAKLQQEQSGGRQIAAYTMEDMIQDFAARQTAKDPVRYVRYGLAEVDAGTYTQLGDVVIIGGVGRVYPYMRSHNVLNNLQHVFDDVPVVLLYPGEYSGQSLTLFGEFEDDNYYRAFNIVKG